jgi:hypothetical protein
MGPPWEPLFFCITVSKLPHDFPSTKGSFFE